MEAFPHKNKRVQESFFCVVVCVAAVAALLLAALCIPVRIRLSAAATVFGGHGEIRIAWLCFAVRIPARLYLLRGKRLHVDILHHDGTVRKRIGLAGKKEPPSRWEVSLRSVLMIRRAHATIYIGVKDAPAATAILCGALESAAEVAGKLLLKEVRLEVKSVPVFSQNAFRLNLEGIARVRLGKLIESRLRNRGE